MALYKSPTFASSSHHPLPLSLAFSTNTHTREVMEIQEKPRSSNSPPSEEEDLRKGPWTVEEDILLMNYIALNGEGRWNSLARCAGLKRTGKSCRLRWLNYLRPDVRRGNITPEEQLLILELHCRWGNRWSKIAQYLPGRTDNEIKNYWRTKVQKHAKQLQCDVNSKKFKDIMRYLWMPRLVERIRATSTHEAVAADPSIMAAGEQSVGGNDELVQVKARLPESSNGAVGSSTTTTSSWSESLLETSRQLSSTPASDCFAMSMLQRGGEDVTPADWFEESQLGACWPEALPCSAGGFDDGLGLMDFDQSGWWGESLFSMEDLWLQQQL